MDEAIDLKDIVCNCKSRINEEILRLIDKERWGVLKRKESGIYIGPKKFRCYKCKNEKIMDEIRRTDCGKDYCEVCLIEMMKKSNINLKCECGEFFEPEMLESLNKEIYEKYIARVMSKF